MTDRQTTNGVATPLTGLLDNVLAGVQHDLPEALGTAVSIAHPAPRHGGGQLRVIAATGVGHVLPAITTGYLWGPSLLVAAGEEPLITADLWHDPRWPHLTLDAVLGQLPESHRMAVSKVRGVAAVPAVWDETGGEPGVVVLSAYLDRPANRRALAILARHEPLVTSAISIAVVATRSFEETDRVLDALASRAVIEQAKGSIMALCRCDANRAWEILRMTSQQCNVKLRELALAFVEHVGRAPAQQPEDIDHRVTAGPAARAAADLMWQALTDPVDPTAPTLDELAERHPLPDASGTTQ